MKTRLHFFRAKELYESRFNDLSTIETTALKWFNRGLGMPPFKKTFIY
jgi:hypothetical protein